MTGGSSGAALTDDQIQEHYAKARAALREAQAGLTASHEQFRALSPHVLNASGRGQINQALWDCERALGRRPHHFSQSGQDAFLDERIFGGKTGGVFVEVGGYDGITGSNCLFFEMMRGWSGLLIEPSPGYHALCQQRRRVECLQLACGGEEGVAEFLDILQGMKQMSGLLGSYEPGILDKVKADPRHQGDVIEVEIRPLGALLDERGMAEIDYISLDVEGAEMDVLSGFPFDRIAVTAWTVENNTADRDVPNLMAEKGYRRVEALGVDDVYIAASQE
ncbi:MAG: FkbM family methyltransferase [Pseudomonadota bacterium]